MINKNYLKKKKNIVNYIYKITKCMEMISIFKYKLLYKKFINYMYYRNFFIKLLNNLDFKNNIFFLNKDFYIKNILYLVISTEKGLCGNLNLNLYKNIILHIKKKKYTNKKIYFFLLGRKNNNLINLLNLNKINFIILKENISDNKFKNIYKYITNKIIHFYSKNINTIIYISSNNLNNNILINRILPINNINKFNKINYIYESNKHILFNKVIFEYINSNIIYYILNNIVVEYYSRISVMKNASLNSNNLYKKINLIYNKLRQFNITKEIIELISTL